MKHGKRPTVAQSKLMQRRHLNPADWFVVKDTPTEMHIVHRHFDNVRKVIVKGERQWN